VGTFQLPGSRKIRKVEEKPTVGSISAQWLFVFGGFFCTNSQPWCIRRNVMEAYKNFFLVNENIIFEFDGSSRDPLFETCSVPIIQNLLGSIYYNTCKSIKNKFSVKMCNWKLQPEIQCRISKVRFFDFQQRSNGSDLGHTKEVGARQNGILTRALNIVGGSSPSNSFHGFIFTNSPTNSFHGILFMNSLPPASVRGI